MEVTFNFKDGSEYIVRNHSHGDYATPGTAQKIMNLIDGVIKDGFPPMDIFDRVCFVAINSRMCRKCGCSKHNPCIGHVTNCAWAEEDLCTFCKAGVTKALHPYGN